MNRRDPTALAIEARRAVDHRANALAIVAGALALGVGTAFWAAVDLLLCPHNRTLIRARWTETKERRP